MHWKDKELIGSSSFEPTVVGLADFRSYLTQTESITSQFLIDVPGYVDFANMLVMDIAESDGF